VHRDYLQVYLVGPDQFVDSAFAIAESCYFVTAPVVARGCTDQSDADAVEGEWTGTEELGTAFANLADCLLSDPPQQRRSLRRQTDGNLHTDFGGNEEVGIRNRACHGRERR
jgi:hypothetical protein